MTMETSKIKDRKQLLEDAILQSVCQFEKDVEILKVSSIYIGNDGVKVKLEVNL